MGNASVSWCSQNSSRPKLRVVLIDTARRLLIMHRAFGLEYIPPNMHKNTIAYFVAFLDTSTPYMFHTDDDVNVSAAKPVDWLAKSLRILERNPRLHILSVMACGNPR